MIIEKVIPQDDYILYIVAENQQTGLFDVSPYLESGVFARLKEADNFQRVSNGRYYVEWECGADLSADTIEARWRRLDQL